MLNPIPNNHWLHRYPKLLASQLFLYDPVGKIFRLLVPRELVSHRKLLKQLLHDILDSHTIQLPAYVWNYLGPDLDLDGIEDESLHQQFTKTLLWTKFESKYFRLHNYTSAKSKKLRIPHEQLKSFWSSYMLLPARQVWYRVLANKLPHGLAIYRMQVIDSPICRLCREAEDDFTRFVVSYPVRLDVWYRVLHKQYPMDTISHENLLSVLCSLKFPDFIKTTAAKSKYYTIISTIQYFIWTHFWKYIIDRVPFSLNNVQQTINKHIDILLNPIDSA